MMNAKEFEEAAEQAQTFQEALLKDAKEMDAEDARQNVAFLMRSLELMAMGAEDIEITRHGRSMTREEIMTWAKVDAVSLRKTLEANGLSTDWR